MKKYEFTDETRVFNGKELHRIRALKSFGCVNAGDLGGFIEREENLSQDGGAWVYGNARVYGNAWVYGDAEVHGNAWVHGNAQVCGDAWVYGNAQVCGDAWVYGDAEVHGNAWVYGNARVYGNAQVCGNAWVYSGDAVLWISSIGSRAGTTTFFACRDKKIYTSCGCFFGDIEEFAAKVRQTHGDSRYGKVYRMAIEMAKAHIVVPGEGEPVND